MSLTQWTRDDLMISDVLSEGKWGDVYLAHKVGTHSAVAVKVMLKKHEKCESYDKTRICQLKREIHIHCRLRHPNIVRVLGVFQHCDAHFMVLEYAPLGDLYKYMKTLPQQRYAEEGRAFGYLAQIARALQYCHANNVIHRDVKPDNALLFDDNVVKLADFGWAVTHPTATPPATTTRDEKSVQRRMTICGTLDYLPPEMVSSQPHDHRVDIWELGVSLYEMVFGYPPFLAKTYKETYARIGQVDVKFDDADVQCSKQTQALIYLMLKRKPKDRATLEQLIPMFDEAATIISADNKQAENNTL